MNKEIIEIRKAKNILKKGILKLIDDFNKEHSVYISSVCYNTTQLKTSNEFEDIQICNDIKIEIMI